MEVSQELILMTAAILVVFIMLYCLKLHYEVAGIRVYYMEKKRDWWNIVLVLGAAFLVKLIFASHYEGHGTDMNCFYAWSDMIYDNGIGKFYYLDAFTDYPPGYMAILWVIAAIRHLFSIATTSDMGRVLIKLVPILADLAAGFLLYLLAKKKFSEGSSLLLALTYVLNPIVVLDSSVWGQTDGTFTFLVLLTCYFCMEEKRIPAYFAFVIGVLLKPQTLVFAPIILWTIIEQVFLKDFKKEKVLRDLIGGVSAIAAMFILILPFGMGKVLHQYVDTLGSYEYCTINAYNVWALLGKNWADQSGTFLNIEYRHWGMLAIFAAVALSALVFFKCKEDKSKYFISMSIVVSTMFLFSVRMHERYMFPVVVLTLAAFLVKPTKELFFTSVGFSVVQFLNVYHVLYTFVEFESTGPTGGIIGMTAILTLAVYGYLFFACFSKTAIQPMQVAPPPNKKERFRAYFVRERSDENKEKRHWEKRGFIRASKKIPAMQKRDWLVLFAIMLFYSLLALHDLGNSGAPETGWNYYAYKNHEANTEDNEIILDMGEEVSIDMLHTFLGNYENRQFQLDLSQDGKNYESVGVVSAGSVFTWNEMKVEDVEEDSYNLVKKYRYIRLTANNNESVLKELIITDNEGNVLEPVNAADYSALFDEQEYYEDISTFRDGTYFDEIYHARTAYEIVHNLYCYENTHPPLGKYFISLGIRLFGMNPFGWRIMGTLFGIGMLPFLFFFGRRLFDGKTWAAGAATFLFAFDFMHFTQTRIATIDVYGTFFIIAMFYFMYRYSQTSFYDTDLKKTFVPLGLSAVMMGLGCASKWTGVYAAAGLAVFFAAIMVWRYLEYREARKNHPEGETEGISHAHIVKVYKKNTIYTLAFCFVFFILIAGGIYLASYIPFSDGAKNNQERFQYIVDKEVNPDCEEEYTETYRGIAEYFQEHDSPYMRLVAKMVKNQRDMYIYHSRLEATHAYASEWYKWPIMYRPVFYYCNTLADGTKEGISAFGNPLVWWAGIPAFLCILFLAVYLLIKERELTPAFLAFGYLVQYVPWMKVSRCTFAYHYFPSVPFIVLMIVYLMYRLVRRDKKWLKWCMSYLGAAFVLFLLFYPVLSGEPVTDTFVRDGLRWMESWVFII